MVLASVASTVRADPAPLAPQTQPDRAPRGKPGLLATGLVLGLAGVGHITLGTLGVVDATREKGTASYGGELEMGVSGLSIGVGLGLLAAGIPLMVYGALAKSHVQVSVAPQGFLLSGSF